MEAGEERIGELQEGLQREKEAAEEEVMWAKASSEGEVRAAREAAEARVADVQVWGRPWKWWRQLHRWRQLYYRWFDMGPSNII